MLSGDHVLPRITPNIPFHPQASADPLGDFLRSLERLEAYDADEVLPAHEHRFVGLDARLTELRAHHEHRFAEVVNAINEGVTTAWDIAARMRWSRPWDRIEGFMRRAAVGEAMAHLRALENRGVVREVDVGILDELIERHTSWWSASDWLTQFGPNPERASYPDFYRLLIPPDLWGDYDAPGWTANGVEPWGVQMDPIAADGMLFYKGF